MMTTWYRIDPAAPLVFRSGRPFGVGSRDGAQFPWPSSLAGLLRTVSMDARQWRPSLSSAQQDALRQLPAGGPFLVREEANGKLEVWLPKPADAVQLREEDGTGRYHRLVPQALPDDGTGCDLPVNLLPLSFAQKAKGKPVADPAWWPLTQYLRWLRGEPVSPGDMALDGTPWQVASRTHVSIDCKTMAAEDGRLFQTDGLDFDPLPRAPQARHAGWQAGRWLLAGMGPKDLPPGAVTFGGERRLSWLAPLEAPLLPAPAGWSGTLKGGLAFTLATPALFAQGWRPGWLDDDLCGEFPGIPGLRLRLKAAAVERWQSVSGWDLASWKPRAARKAVAAGATYWFEILAGDEEQLSRLWLASASDDEQDRRDGFGLGLPRPWHPTFNGEH